MSTVQDIQNRASVLLEIGTEEVPSRFLPGAIRDLKAIAAKTFGEYRVDYADSIVYATPRRLALIVTGITATQKDMVREVFGPAKKAAYDDQGNPTKAASGFAASLGIQVTDLSLKQKGKGDYVVAVVEEKGKETKAEIEMLGADLTGAEASLAGIQTSIDSEKYGEAKDSANLIKEKAASVSSQVQAAIDKKKKK